MDVKKGHVLQTQAFVKDAPCYVEDLPLEAKSN
jgi:hypothetical protein